MSPHRCQICNRRKGLKQDGGIVMHHVGGLVCKGVGFPPIEESHAQLVAEVNRVTDLAEAIWKRIEANDREHAAKRLNYPLSATRYEPYLKASQHARRLTGRLNRWRCRERTKARQLERYGYTL